MWRYREKANARGNPASDAGRLLARDDDGYIAAGHGDDYVTVADMDCSGVDIAEREANKALVIHWHEHGPKLVTALMRLIHNAYSTESARVPEASRVVDAASYVEVSE